MEQEFKISEEWLSITLRNIGDAVIAIDKKGSINFMNIVARNFDLISREVNS